MEIRKGYSFKLKTNGEHNRKLRQYCGNARHVYNRALFEAKAAYVESKERWSCYAVINKMASSWKVESAFLTLSPSQTLQQAIMDLDRAFKNFWSGRASFPRPHKRGVNDSIRFPQGFKLDEANSRVFLPKLGWIRYRRSRQIHGVVKHVVVKRDGNDWFVIFNTHMTVDVPAPVKHRPVGLDRGIDVFAARPKVS